MTLFSYMTRSSDSIMVIRVAETPPPERIEAMKPESITRMVNRLAQAQHSERSPWHRSECALLRSEVRAARQGGER